PEAALHDRYHEVQAALVDHDRPAAAAAAAALQAAAPGHRLALQAERSLASYDGSEERQLAATEALLAAFPDDVNLRLSRQASLGSLGQRQARVEWLRAEHARAPHPLLDQMLGEALMDDARDLGEALALAWASVRRRPGDALAYHLLGDALWNRGERDASLRAYRWGACLERTNEHFADAYFRAARCLGRTAEALDFLRGRFERHGGRSARPTMTLVDALEALERGAEGLAALERAIARRPDDGALLLYAARTFSLAGQGARGRALLERARGDAHRVEVLRTEALLEELEGDLATAAAARVEASELEPLGVGAAQAAARLLAETRDRAAAAAFLRARVARFPNHVGLGRALVGWLDEEPPEVLEAELRRLLAAAPADAWAWRELALHLSLHGRLDEAFQVLERAAAVEPDAPALRNVRGTVLARAGRTAEARAALRESLRLEVDQEWTIDRLLGLAADAAERAGDLRFLHAELVRQVTFGDALLAWQRHAAGVIPPEEALATLREAHAARPDLWQAWVALGGQLVLLERTDEALAHLGAATARFPLLPRVWLELGLVHRARGDAAGWRAMLERALELNPAWREATFKLAELLQGAGELEPARALLARALRHAPSDGVLHGWLADVLLAMGRGEEALDELQRALRLEPGYGWALETLRREARRLGRPGLPDALAAQLVAERPLDARAWLLAGRAREGLAPRLEAVERALSLSPLFAAAVTLRVDLLAEAGRFDEAVAAAAAPPWQGPPPRALRLRVAQLEAQRGRTAEARAALEALLSGEPDFLEGWEVAAEWHDAAGRREDCLAAARQLVRLAPQRSTSLGWLGLALLATGDRAGGKEAIERAVQLDPAYHWAVRRLLELRVEDREWEGAEALMVLVDRHFEPPERHALRLRISAARTEWRRAAVDLAGVAGGEDARELEGAIEVVRRAGGLAQVEAELAAALVAPDAPRAAGAAWFALALQALA
ncbi:MAG: hypothetical protein NDI82_12920, partial [Anaeromyxobacteraceae bacterium]|nr:hypothetical protein [Anaeromyxobacteraceae bacterium]